MVGADLAPGADDVAFQERKSRFDCVRVNIAANLFFGAVIEARLRRVFNDAQEDTGGAQP
jgi:hypothetical protein